MEPKRDALRTMLRFAHKEAAVDQPLTPPTDGPLRIGSLPSNRAGIRRWASRLLGLVVAALVLLFLPQAVGVYWTGEVTLAFIYVVATLGTDLVVGRTGILSLCQASFMGIGAYTVAIGQAHDLPIVVQLIVAAVVAVVAGAIVALPTLKLSGLRLAIVTLLFGQLFIWAIDVDISLTGGSEGMTVNPVQIGAFTSISVRGNYILTATVAIVATIIAWQVTRGQWGRRTLAVRDSELAASSVGIDVRRTKVTAFMLGALFCSIAGVLFAYTQGTVAPTTFDTFPSVYLLVAVLLGGAGSLGGAWLGGAYLVLVPDVFNALGIPNLYAVLGGAVLVIFTLLLPGGLASLRSESARLIRRRATGDRTITSWVGTTDESGRGAPRWTKPGDETAGAQG